MARTSNSRKDQGLRRNKTSRANSDSTPKDDMVEYVVKEFERYESFHKERFDIAEKIYNHWRNVPNVQDQSWHNQVAVPMTFEAEQTITPRIYSALFPNEAPLDLVVHNNLKVQETEEAQAIAKMQGVAIKNLIAKNFRVSNVQGKSHMALTQSTLLGTGYMEDTWLTRRKWQVDKVTKERYEALVDNRPECEAVSFFEMFPHPNKLHMNDGLPIIRRRFADAEWIKKLEDMPEFDAANIKKALDSKLPIPKVSTALNRGRDGKNTKGSQKKRDEYEILEYWGGWDESYVKDNEVVKRKAVPYWIIVINREVKVRGIPNPYNHQDPPYVKGILYPDVSPSWFGVGVGQVGKPTQERLNKIVNQRLDNVDLVLNKQGFYNGNDPMINTKKLQVSEPGRWHKVSDTVNSIRWMDTPDVTASSYKEEELAKADFRESTGATIPLLPTEAEQHRTASGINLLQGAAGARFRPIIRGLEHDLIQELARHYLSNLQQFMILPEWVDATSEDGAHEPVLVRPEEIQAQVTFMPTGLSELLNKEVQIGQLLRFKEVTANDPTVNRAEINKRIGELMGFKEFNKLIVQQQPADLEAGISPDQQELIRQRLAEGASPDQIKAELLGDQAAQASIQGEAPQQGVPQQPQPPQVSGAGV